MQRRQTQPRYMLKAGAKTHGVSLRLLSTSATRQMVSARAAGTTFQVVFTTPLQGGRPGNDTQWSTRIDPNKPALNAANSSLTTPYALGPIHCRAGQQSRLSPSRLPPSRLPPSRLPPSGLPPTGAPDRCGQLARRSCQVAGAVPAKSNAGNQPHIKGECTWPIGLN